MIKHVEARKHLNFIYNYCDELPRQHELEQYITEREKEDQWHKLESELLQLYKELSDVRKELIISIYEGNLVDEETSRKKEKRIINQIITIRRKK